MFKFFKSQINVHENTSRITLHSKLLNLDIPKICVTQLGKDGELGDRLKIRDTEVEEVNDFFSIDLYEQLEKGKQYNVYIPFNASLNKGLMGYYRSSYIDKQLKKRV